MSDFMILAGTNYADAIKGMVFARLPEGRFVMKPPTTLTTPHLIYEHLDDPWGEAELLALSIGMRLKRRGDGVIVYTPLRERVRQWRWQYVTQPVRRVRRRVEDLRNPPIEYPDPDYSD